MRRAASAARAAAHAAASTSGLRTTLSELRSVAVEAQRFSVTVVGRATPVALAELARTALATAHCHAAPPTVVRPSFAAAALSLPRRPVARALLAGADGLLTLARAIQLMLLFSPLFFSAPLCLLYNVGREHWMNLLNQTLRSAGPAFIKWGQARARVAAKAPPPRPRPTHAPPSGQPRVPTSSRRTCATC